MQSGKQKRASIMARRQRRSEQQATAWQAARSVHLPADRVGVNQEALAAFASCGAPEFVWRGFYSAVAFRCRDCGVEQIWTARAQKWWYETAQGSVYSTAVRCRSCRQEKRVAPHRRRDERTAPRSVAEFGHEREMASGRQTLNRR